MTAIPSLTPSTAEATYTWTTSSAKIAAVSADGIVTPVAEGKATITVTAIYGKVKKTAKVTVTVADPKKPTAVALNTAATETIYIGTPLQLIPSLTPSTAEATYTWTTSSAKAATVSADGIVTPVAEGKATITVTATYGSVKKTAKVVVTVADPEKPTAVILNTEAKETLYLGNTLKLSPTLEPATAKGNITYATSSAAVATVSTNGIVTPMKEGTATITVKATYGSVVKSAKVLITVADPKKPASVTISGDSAAAVNSSVTLTAAVEPASATECVFAWKSSATKYATVTYDGATCEVTGVKAGTATITCTVAYTDASGKKTTKSATYKVKVS